MQLYMMTYKILTKSVMLAMLRDPASFLEERFWTSQNDRKMEVRQRLQGVIFIK